MQYKIELRYIYGWDDAGWTDEIDGKEHPTRFGTIAEAETDIYEFLSDVKTAIAAGDMQLGYNREDFQIAEVTASDFTL